MSRSWRRAAMIGVVGCVALVSGWTTSAEAVDCWRKSGTNEIYYPNELFTLGDFWTSPPVDNRYDKNGTTYVRVPCPEGGTPQPGGPPGAFQFYVFGQASMLWGTNSVTSVTPQFDINANGLMGGGGVGMWFPIAGTMWSVGPRFAVLFGSPNGDITNPPASPGFNHAWTVNLIVTTEAAVKAPFAGSFFQAFTTGGPQRYAEIRASLGAAFVNSEVRSVSGPFSIVDGATNIGITGSIGLAIPVAPTINLFAAYQPIFLPTVQRRFPGIVDNSMWIHGLNFGVELNF